MKDRDFLIWIHERLEHAHKEDCLLDYMQKLRCIIRDYPKNKETPNDGRGFNDLDKLIKKLKIKE